MDLLVSPAEEVRSSTERAWPRSARSRVVGPG